MSRRPSLRSPYRIVPILVALLIVAAAVYQATQPPAKATKQDIAAAEALEGRCLVRNGGSSQLPHFSGTPVSCSSGGAVARVVDVIVPGKPGSCPKSSLLARVLNPGVAGEPVECLVPISGR
ncbi:MAG TPA: hypothetical protein VL984_03045 [Acidimicrobiales bacterium]|nr:hypothetical protein [Acidimicrobiales bacterium]